MSIFDLDTDSNGRWSVERFKDNVQVERRLNVIGQRTRRGKGNYHLFSDVGTEHKWAIMLDYGTHS